MHYVTYQYVVEIHDNLIDEYGGRKGILNEGLLRSALEMPKARFDGKDSHRTIFDKTAAYLFHLIQSIISNWGLFPSFPNSAGSESTSAATLAIGTEN